MKKFSALSIMKRINLWQRIFSISSALKPNPIKKSKKLIIAGNAKLKKSTLDTGRTGSVTYLFDADAYSDWVYWSFDEDFFFLISADDYWHKKQLLSTPVESTKINEIV